jgi:hypothetical protein
MAQIAPVPGGGGRTSVAGTKGKGLARQGESRLIKILNDQKLQSKIQAGKEKRQGLPGMAKDLDPQNKSQSKKK